MDISIKCHQLKNKFSESPLRTQSKMQKLTQFNVEEYPFRLDKIIENIQHTLKVFVIGEVKAGKSSLINALVGQEISPTNVLEATASLWEIGYAAEESVQIEYIDGSSESVPFCQVQEILSISNEENLEKAKNINCVRVRTHQHDFRELLLIDSPGLATITEQNAQLTRSILEDVDIALWVLNANHLGQTDIMQEIEALARLGKPIVAVISKIDEVETTPERLIRYVNRHVGEYFQDIFALSAHSYQNDDEFADYFVEFKSYLKEQVAQRAKIVKSDSIESSLEALIQAEKTTHQSIVRQLNYKVNDLACLEDDLSFEKEMLKAEIDSFVDQQCTTILKSEDLEQNLRAILLGKTSNSSMETETTVIKQAINKVGNPFHKINNMQESTLDQIVNHEMHKIHDKAYPFYMDALKRLLGSVQLKNEQRFNKFKEQEEFLLQSSLGAFDEPEYLISDKDSNILDSTLKATAISAAAGTMAAGYTAFLGANAAAISMGAAMTAIALPVVMCGAVVGGVLAYMQKDKNQIVLQNEVSRLKQKIFEEVRHNLLKNYHEKIELDIQVIKNNYIDSILGGYDALSFHEQIYAIENYVNRL